MKRMMLGSLIAAVGSASGSAVAADDSGAWYVSPMGQYHDLDPRRISKDNFGGQIGLGCNLPRVAASNEPGCLLSLKGIRCTPARDGESDIP